METDQLERRELRTQFDRYQSLLFPFAYNITGDFMAAEDVVQEVLNHHFLSPAEHIEKPDHYLIRSVINRAINQKNLLRSKMEKNPEQIKKVLRGYLRSLRALRQDRADVTQFVGQRFNLDRESAGDVYNIMLETMSDDGIIPRAIMERVLEDTKREAGVKRAVALSDIIDYRLLKEVSQQVEK